jgi:hypothetical protein
MAYGLATRIDIRGRRWRGYYHRDDRLIVLRPRKHDIETIAHEFAHHLDHERGWGWNEPPLSLPEVRRVLAPETDGRKKLR